MQILVTGLCLSRNLGGAAMALTLVQELQKRFNNQLSFTFAVSAIDYKQELQWAKYYNLKVCKYAHLSTYLSHIFLLRYIPRLLKKRDLNYIKNAYKFWDETFKDLDTSIAASDIVIDLSGVSYIGDGSRDIYEGLNSFSNYYFAKKFNKSYIRFTQSYGPINNLNTSFFAKYEFNHLDTIFARGKQSLEECKKIAPNANVIDFPDIAVLLEPEKLSWAKEYLHANKVEGKYIVLSPSSVAYRLKDAKTSAQSYIELFANIASYLQKLDMQLVFLPHMYSDNKNECDIEVAKKVLSLLDPKKITLIEDELTPMQAKAIIANSEYAIVSRYHALVAALSSSTKVIAVGWNIKYRDLLAYYNMENFALDLKNKPQHILYKEFQELFGQLQNQNFEKIDHVNDLVIHSFELLEKLINKHVAR
jgi:polysaccharide pyruvyl transferase WcaK-like protein